MIEWGSPDWGGRVHYAENGSWVRDKHDKDADRDKRDKGKRKRKSAIEPLPETDG